MVFRVDAIRARLQRLEEVSAHLQELAQLDCPTLRTSWRDRSAAERSLQLGAEDVLEQLAQQGIVDDDLRLRLKGLGGFRNLLVHDYLRIDPEKVTDAVSRAPQDFDDFGQAIQRWLGGRDEGA